MSEALERLRAAFRAKESVVVAFSGGVDSALLAKVAADELGERALALVVDGESYPRAELEAAVALAREIGVRHEVVHRSELADPRWTANDAHRCYFCRQGLAETAFEVARARGFAAVAVGTNASDLGEWRPGLLALQEARAWQPLLELGLGKDDVRALAREVGLPVADRPAMACLASRIPYGETVTDAKLRRVERAEAALRARGYRVVRVRSLGERARVEVGADEVARAQGEAAAIEADVRDAGFAHVEIDPRGYRSGAMNEGLGLTLRLP